MNHLFSMDNKFFLFMGRVADLIILNVLWMICCLPIVTIGASTTSLFYVTMKMVDNEESYIIRGFFKSFKQNLKQSTVIWMIMLILGIVLGADITILSRSGLPYKNYLLPVFYFMALIYFFTLLYVFPLLAKFANTTKNILKNSLLFSIRFLPSTFLIAVIVAGSGILGFIFIQTLPFWILIGFSLIAFCTSFLYMRIFKKFIPEEASADLEEL